MASLPLAWVLPTARLGVGCGVEVGDDEDRFPVRFRCCWDWSAFRDTNGMGFQLSRLITEYYSSTFGIFWQYG